MLEFILYVIAALLLGFIGFILLAAATLFVVVWVVGAAEASVENMFRRRE